jgi:hypothetical protein
VKRLFIIIAFLAPLADAQTITWIKYDPSAIRFDRTAPATLELVTAGNVAGVRIDFTGSGSLTLTAAAPNRWSGSVPAARLLAGYDASDVNHNFVGFVRLLDGGGQTISSYNSFINVVDSRVAAPAIRQFDAAARAATRILNLYRPFVGPNDVQNAIQQFYTYYAWSRHNVSHHQRGAIEEMPKRQRWTHVGTDANLVSKKGGVRWTTRQANRRTRPAVRTATTSRRRRQCAWRSSFDGWWSDRQRRSRRVSG